MGESRVGWDGYALPERYRACHEAVFRAGKDLRGLRRADQVFGGTGDFDILGDPSGFDDATVAEAALIFLATEMVALGQSVIAVADDPDLVRKTGQAILDHWPTHEDLYAPLPAPKPEDGQ